MLERAHSNSKITWSLDKVQLEFLSDNKGVTGTEEVIETDGIFVAIGYKLNTGFLNGHPVVWHKSTVRSSWITQGS